MKRDKESQQRGNILQSTKYQDGRALDEYTAVENAAHSDRLVRFNARQGHGYAAEQANHLIDRIHGRDARILGDDNAKAGPDRMVNGQLIQTKYCANARASVDAAFRSGQYRYLDANGNPMQIEVPSDQYQDAVQIMRKRITEGKVPGVSDPDAAEKLVRKGSVDYKTACSIAKAGTIDSLVFDAVNGAVIASSAAGISALITFAKSVWDGESVEKSVDLAMYHGLQTGGMAFAGSVLTAQLTRTGLNNVLAAPSIEVVRMLPSPVRKALLSVMRDGAVIYENAATKSLAKLIRSNIIANGALVLVLSASDISDFFRGRISGKQLFKNLLTVAGGIGGGCVGALGGTAVAGVLGIATGPAGAAVILLGGIAGGTIGGDRARTVANQFAEDDAEEMVRILYERIVPLAQEYLLSQEELDLVLAELQMLLAGDKLLEMYASEDRAQFADTLLTDVIQRTIRWRVRIRVPDDGSFAEGMGRVLALSEDTSRLQQHLARKQVDTVALGRELLGREVSKYAAGKAWYITKQMNAVSVQQEQSLRRMGAAEQDFARSRQQSDDAIAAYRAEITMILEENNHEQ